jgi:hypothetical protein
VASTIDWTYGGTNPDAWSVQDSGDGGLTWSEIDFISGTERTFGGLNTGDLGRVVGEDSIGNPTLEPSNSVVIP